MCMFKKIVNNVLLSQNHSIIKEYKYYALICQPTGKYHMMFPTSWDDYSHEIGKDQGYANSKGSGEPAHPYSLAWTYVNRSRKRWAKGKLLQSI